MMDAAAPRARTAQATARPGLPVLLLAALGAAGAIATLLPQVDRQEDALLVGITLGSAVLVLNRAAWALAPVLIGELSIASFFIPDFGMSLRLAATLLAALSAAFLVLRSSTLADARFRRVILPALALVALATAINALFSGLDYTLKYARYQAVQVLALLVAAAVITSRRDLRRLGLLVLGVSLVTALAAIWQHYDRTTALNADLVTIWKGRAVGLSGSPVLLANQLTFAIPPLIGLLAVGPWRLDRLRLALLALVGLLTVALYFTYTRSGLLALGPGLVAMGLCLRGRRRVLLIGLVAAAAAAYLLLQGTGLIGARYYKTATDDTSTASHQALFDVALAIALENPIVGIGHEHFEDVSAGFIGDVPVSRGDVAIGQERPHNDFLTVWVSWGFGALAIYLGLFLGAARNFLRAARYPDPLVRGLAVGCLGGLATYAAGSAFHNYLDSSALLWVYAGFSVALARLATRSAPPGAPVA